MSINRTRISATISYVQNLPRMRSFKSFLGKYTDNVGFIAAAWIARDIQRNNPGVSVRIIGGRFHKFDWMVDDYVPEPRLLTDSAIDAEARRYSSSFMLSSPGSSGIRDARRLLGPAPPVYRSKVHLGSRVGFEPPSGRRSSLGSRITLGPGVHGRGFSIRQRMGLGPGSALARQFLKPVKRKYLSIASNEIEERIRRDIHREDPDTPVTSETTYASAEDIHKDAGGRGGDRGGGGGVGGGLQSLYPTPPGGNKGTDPGKRGKPSVKITRKSGSNARSTWTAVQASVTGGKFSLFENIQRTVYVPEGGFKRADNKPFVMHKPEGTRFRSRTYTRFGGQWITRRGRAAELLLNTLRLSERPIRG